MTSAELSGMIPMIKTVYLDISRMNRLARKLSECAIMLSVSFLFSRTQIPQMLSNCIHKSEGKNDPFWSRIKAKVATHGKSLITMNSPKKEKKNLKSYFACQKEFSYQLKKNSFETGDLLIFYDITKALSLIFFQVFSSSHYCCVLSQQFASIYSWL